MATSKRKPATPGGRNRNQQSGSKPGRVFIAGLATGVMLTLLIQNWTPIRQQLFGPDSIADQPPQVADTTPDDPLEFEFYTRLPQMEVPVDTSREQSTDNKKTSDYLYMLQVGSFDRKADAERLKAQLALLGEVAMIQDVAVNGVSMHRVRLGPFSSSRKLDVVRNRLTAEDIPTMALKIRRPAQGSVE